MVQTMPEGYLDAVMDGDRTIDVFLSLGSSIDTTAADDLTSITGDFLPMSNTDQMADAVYLMTTELATFEGYGIKTSTDAGMIAPPIQATHYPPETGLWSSAISDEDGNIDFTVTITLSKAHTSAFQVYTTGPSVVKATMTFIDGDSSVTAECDCFDGFINVSQKQTYSQIVIHITRIDGAYRHVRLVELEFGASITLSKRDLGGEVVHICETDPLELSAPLHELDLSIVNVTGVFDPDNPASRLPELQIGYPIKLSYTVNGQGKKFTVPCGQFYIGERQSSSTRLDITAFDSRFLLSSIYAQWSISTDQNFGAALDGILTEYAIPHFIDDPVYQIKPDAAHAFDGQSSVADDLLSIQQAYGIYCVPDRSGSLRVTTQWLGGDYGTVPSEAIYSWPSPNQSSRYNFISIGYTATDGGATEYVEKDLRTDQTEGKTVLQIGGNKLITSKARATEVMNRLLARLYSEMSETDWRGDPAVDLGDTVKIPGKWTQDAPKTFRVVSMEETYDGTYRSLIKGSS